MLKQSRRRIRGEILTDPASRARYSLADCIYRVTPCAAVLPASRDDVHEVLRWAQEEGLPLTARGAGSAVAGQSVGSGIILDFSAHMDRILEIQVQERWARVEPGVVLGDLNRKLAESGLRFAPDPSSAEFCTLGGMIANNAGGPRSVRYGPTRDHVVSLIVALATGEVVETRPLQVGELSREPSDPLHRLSRSLFERVSPRLEEIRGVTPLVRRNASGYELLRSVHPQGADLTQLLIGSEGTLAVTLEAKLKLTQIPGAVATALLYFRDLDSLGLGVLQVLRHDPSAVEALDRSFLDLVRLAGQEEVRSLPADTEAVLIVELEGADAGEVAGRLEQLASNLVRGRLADGILSGLDPATRSRIWEIRKAASPILTARQQHLRNTRFIEDACVPNERLPEFLREIRRMLAHHRLQAAIFGHAGDAILHVNPFLDPGEPRIAAQMEQIAGEYDEMVLSLGGALSGEHGDGRLRTPFLGRAFGEVAQLFGGIKEEFDPGGLLNPGIKVHDGKSRMTDHLDLGPRPARRLPSLG
jgi:FAD/FMN-containing dehydrogenase